MMETRQKRGRTARNKAVSIVNGLMDLQFFTHDQRAKAYDQVEKRVKSSEQHSFKLKPPTVNSLTTTTAYTKCMRCGCERVIEHHDGHRPGAPIDRHIRIALTYGDNVNPFPPCS